jgi:hypothetical protein
MVNTMLIVHSFLPLTCWCITEDLDEVCWGNPPNQHVRHLGPLSSRYLADFCLVHFADYIPRVPSQDLNLSLPYSKSTLYCFEPHHNLIYIKLWCVQSTSVTPCHLSIQIHCPPHHIFPPLLLQKGRGRLRLRDILNICLSANYWQHRFDNFSNFQRQLALVQALSSYGLNLQYTTEGGTARTETPHVLYVMRVKWSM